MKNQHSFATYFKSLNRPILILGIERSLFFLILGLSLPVAFSAHLTVLMDVISIIIFMVLYTLALVFTRSEPKIIIFYLRYFRYASVYLAQPQFHSQPTDRNMSVPIHYFHKEMS
jgi:type IV secretory pathway TrbD component